MTLRTTLLLATCGVAAVLTLLLATHQWGFGHWPDGSQRWRYVFEDVADRNIYEARGRWLPSGRTPYLQEDSEYPQLATWLFGVPYLFFDSSVPKGRAQTAAEVTRAREDVEAYFDLHHTSMALSLLLLMVLTALNLRALGHSPGWALLLFLPGTVYFAFNRFDAWPGAFVAWALLLQWKGRRTGAAAALGLGAMMKWYPILLLPLFLAHNLHTDRAAVAEGKRQGATSGHRATGGWLSLLPRAVIVPGLAAAAVCAVILGITFVWDGGGWAAVKYAYVRQGDRDANAPSLIYALTVPSRWGLFPLADQPLLGRVAMVVQFLPAALLALFPVRSRQALLLGCLTVVLGFMQFGKVFSPQWICWITPLAVLLAPRRRLCLLLLVACELVTYLQNPLLYYEATGAPAPHAPGSPAFWAVVDLRIALLAVFWAWSLVAFLRTVWRRDGDVVPAT